MNRFILKSWYCMFLGLRLLTLVAFSAHAVLGCCLSHGDCQNEQAASISSPCCNHEHHAVEAPLHDHSHHGLNESSDNESSDNEPADIEPVNIGSVEHAKCESGSDHHSHHCDDAQCVFSVAVGSSTSMCHMVMTTHVSWVGLLMDLRHQPVLTWDQVQRSIDLKSLSSEDRALIQVWQI